jgi:PAS domain S-box-containing protein
MRWCVNGTKVAGLLVLLACASPALAQDAAASPDLRDSHWPFLTTALALVMLFYTWWLQAQHRRRMNRANAELTRAFAALSESESKFRLLFERSADAILLIEPTKGPKFVDCNEAAVRLLGYQTKHEVVNLPPGGISAEFQPDGKPSIPKAVEMIEYAIRNGSHRFEWDTKRADGTFITTEVAMTSVQMNAQPLIVTVSRDITERKMVEESLRAHQQLLASILDNISEGVYRSSPERGLIFANKSYLRMFGYESLDDLRSVPRVMLYANPEDRPKLLSQLERKGEFHNEEIEYRRKDGSTFWGLASSMAIYVPDTQAIDYHVGAITDITARKEAEDKIRELNQDLERRIAERTAELKASEARLRTLVEHAPEAIVVFDADTGKFLAVNAQAMTFYGLSRDQLVGRTPADVSPEFQPEGQRSEELAREKIREALEGNTPVFEWIHCKADGTRIPSEVRLVRLPGEGQNLIRASIFDTSRRGRQEKVQRATYQISEAVHAADDLESLFARIHQIINTLMPAQNFYLVLHHPSTGLYHFDYFVDEVDTCPAPRELTNGLNGYVVRNGKALLATRESMTDQRSEWRLVSGTPSAIWLGVPLAHRGKIFGVMAVQDYHNPSAYSVEDEQILTFVAEQIALAIERKRGEQALRESEEKHRALFEATSQGVMLHDEHQFLDVNQAALRILGYEREELIGKHPAQVSPPNQATGESSEKAARAYIELCMEQGSAHFEWTAQNGKGKEVPLEVMLTRIQMGGRPLIQAVIMDITERKKAEAELLKALAREKELGALKGNFVSMVSHEFRTPLGIIMSSAEILSEYFEQLDATDRNDHLKSIQKNTRRMADLMEEVLLLSRVEAGKLTLEAQPIDLPLFCRRLADEVLSATNRRCPIELTVDPFESETFADERLLRHILINLLTNAVKYSREGNPVRFNMTRFGTKVRFEVIDNGIGIPVRDQKWLFNAFHRGRNVGNIPGTGLGLVIVKRCVELHRGNIQIESETGEGTHVEVEVPVAAAALEKKSNTTFVAKLETPA